MGYDLHITRADDWFDTTGAAITADEWLAVVASDPELTLRPEHGPYFAVWSGPSGHADPWLDWTDGRVYTKNPDSPLLRKMVALAERLGARVQGDDGERYSGDEPAYDVASAGATVTRPWWARLWKR